MTAKKQLMTIKDFLEEYAISRSVFYSEWKRNALKVTKLGCRTYIVRKDADEWLENLRQSV